MKASRAKITFEEFTNVSKINSMKLIRQVRQYDVLYNSQAEGYTDKNHKEAVWEHIHKGLFPKYDSLDENLKDAIRTNVRRRWKTLRNSIAREVKKSATIENYCRKKESPIIAELEFLIPHIKSSYCAKLADELSLRDNYYYTNEGEDQDDEESSDLIDLTEEFDIKPNIKFDLSYHMEENGKDGEADGAMPHEALYPTVQMSTPEHSLTNNLTVAITADPVTNISNLNNTTANTTNNNILNDWAKEYCSLAEYKEGEFMNSTVLCSNQDLEDSNSEMPACKALSPTESRKRPRTDTEDSTELQAKILQMLTNLERRERADTRAEQEAQDEDRMFLLSLVSDLKHVPAAKKMSVKAEIANAIANAMQQ